MRVTFNLVPSLLVQLEAFAADRARDRYLELSLKPADDLQPTDVDFILENFFHAQRQRMIDAVSRGTPSCWRDAAGHCRPRPTSARPPAGSRSTTCAICRSGTSSPGSIRSISRAIARVRSLRREGAQLHRGGQGAAARRRARAPEPRSFPSTARLPAGARSRFRPRRSTTRFCRCCATPTSTCGRTPTRRCRVSASCIPRTPPSSSSGPRPATSGCSAGGRPGSGRRKGRCRMPWCRSSPRPASRGWRPTS